jgi:uncharacterized protein YecT (DUF1311 family)
MLHHVKPHTLLAMFILACALPLAAQLEDADATTQDKCSKYLKTPLPPEAAQAPQPKAWPDCNSYKLYSGTGVKIDYTAARRCAWSERLAQQAGLEPRYTVASVFGGAAMLTVLYANGEGVEKSLPLAVRFACEAGGAPAEIAGRVEDLDARFARPNAASKKFDFCENTTSGFMEGFCAAYDSELADVKRANSLQELSARMNQAQLRALAELDKLEQAYARAHAAEEIDLSGTARAMIQIDAEDSLRDDFLAALQSCELSKFPNGSSQTYRDADARLNSTYQLKMNNAERRKTEYGAIQPVGIRDTERAWLKYRDGWVEFARLRYPRVPAEAWLTLLTNDRVSVLDSSFCDMDAAEGPCVQKGDTWKPSPLP